MYNLLAVLIKIMIIITDSKQGSESTYTYMCIRYNPYTHLTEPSDLLAGIVFF